VRAARFAAGCCSAIECVDAGELLIGQLTRHVLRQHRDEGRGRSPDRNCDELVARHFLERAVVAEANGRCQFGFHQAYCRPSQNRRAW
jgi:hypothetical protein